MFSLIVIVLLLSDQYSTAVINTCNDKCLSKIYYISKGGVSSVCSESDLISVIFTMDQVDNELYFSLTLTEDQIIPNKTHHRFSLTLSSEHSSTTYHCNLKANVPGSHVFQNNYQLDEGSSQYVNNNLKCNWNATKKSRVWPFRNHADDLIVSKEVLFTLKYDDFSGSRSIILANDSSELPFYRLQSLKCCHKVRESDQFVFIFHQKDDHINYYLQFFDSTVTKILISFTSLDGVKLIFTCDREKNLMTSFIQDNTSVTSIISELFNVRFDYSHCSWITPLSLSYNTNQLNLLTDNFNLRLISNNVVLYAERNVRFEKIKEISLSSGQSSVTSLTFITLISIHYLQLILVKSWVLGLG